MSNSNKAPPKEHHFGEEIRGGTRGGLEEFKWESLRTESQKDRECYLGSSLRLGMLGKMGRYRKNDWWLEGVGEVDNETEKLKRFEDTLLQEAVGARPKFLLLSKADREQMEEQEMEENIKRLQGKEDVLTDERIETMMVECKELQEKHVALVKQRQELERSLNRQEMPRQRSPPRRRLPAERYERRWEERRDRDQGRRSIDRSSSEERRGGDHRQ
eukprot:GHVH01007144.1.p1 GENE.GHVH01007144.1~~GHVH01007144.1.p1  ORF type:complete len:216 (+),score=32.83 GHVH01007144.1:71-718(+)